MSMWFKFIEFAWLDKYEGDANISCRFGKLLISSSDGV